MKTEDHKEQESRNTKQLNTTPEVQTQGEELTEEELQQVSGAGSKKSDIFWRNQ